MHEQTVLLDQIIVVQEDGCWVPGRDMVPSMLRWICETFVFETICRPRETHAHCCTSLHVCVHLHAFFDTRKRANKRKRERKGKQKR